MAEQVVFGCSIDGRHPVCIRRVSSRSGIERHHDGAMSGHNRSTIMLSHSRRTDVVISTASTLGAALLQVPAKPIEAKALADRVCRTRYTVGGLEPFFYARSGSDRG